MSVRTNRGFGAVAPEYDRIHRNANGNQNIFFKRQLSKSKSLLQYTTSQPAWSLKAIMQLLKQLMAFKTLSTYLDQLETTRTWQNSNYVSRHEFTRRQLWLVVRQVLSYINGYEKWILIK
eukprot:1567377-Amphidinium_carterae.1